MQRSFGRIAEFSLVVLSIVVLGLPASGQSLVQDRIVQAVDGSNRITLVGNVSPLANARYDLGAAPVSQPMNHIQLVLRRSAAQEAALENFLSSVQQPGSPNYHRWLTPGQFGKLYGPSDNDIAKLTAWLSGNGLTVEAVAPGRTHIDFSGSVGQVQSAFLTSIHSYNANGVLFLANTTNPRIPAAFSAVVAGVSHLNTVPLKPMHVNGFAAKYDPTTKRIVPIAGQSRLRPSLTEQDENGNNYLVAVPADVATIYDTPNSKYNANAGGSTTYDGTGAIIGIAGQSSIQTSIVASYRTLFIGDAKVPTIFNPDNVGDVPGDDTESYLDNEVAGSMAPGASIYFYTEPAADGGVFYAAQQAVEANAVDILTISYGDCESDQGNASNAAINGEWQQAAAQGITVLVSTGDTGSAGCDENTDSEGNPITSASGGVAVNGLGSTPYNVAVGGTDYDILSTNFGGYVSTPSNGGSASTFYRTAMKYIPEDTWNDSPITNATVAQNVPLASNPQDAANANISGGAGGKSSCAVQIGTGSGGGYLPPSSCTSGYPKPSWQTGTGVPNDSVRDIPDVSLLSGDGAYNALWAVCDNTPDGNGGTLDCIATNGSFENDAVGGTSAATPAFASIFALVRQKTGGRLGQAASTLYALFAGSGSSSIFHDVTTGNNSVPCTQSTANAASCVANTAGYFFESGYDTNVGYDLATGLGSVDVTQLVNAWGASTTPITPTVTVTTTSAEIAVTDPLPITVTVAGPAGSATPTGSVTLTVGSYVSAATTLTTGSATITVPANTLTPGSYTASAAYTPDSASSGTYFAGSGTVAITVGGSFSFPATPPTAVTVVAGATTGNTTTATVSTSNGYTGTVTFSCTIATEPSGANASYYPGCTPAGTVTIASGQTSGSTTIAFATTARSTTTSMAVPLEKSRPSRWYIPAGGVAGGRCWACWSSWWQWLGRAAVAEAAAATILR
jgi:subtilase family serine protease